MTAKLKASLIFLSLTCLLFAGEESDLMQKGREALQARDFAKAETLFSQAVELNPQNGNAWMTLANIYYSSKRYEKAVTAYQGCIDAGYAVFLARYNGACSLALTGDLDAAFEWLDQAFATGYTDLDHIEKDADLVELRKDSRWSDLVLSAKKRIRPCEYDERYNQLDFWLGDWNIYDQYGTLIGTNHIAKSEKGCLITENFKAKWTDMTGFSMNYFNIADGKWHQDFMGSGGGVTYFDGQYHEGGILFMGNSVNPQGQGFMVRMLIKPNEDGSVVQTVENSNDAGKTWNRSFFGHYKKAEPAKSESAASAP